MTIVWKTHRDGIWPMDIANLATGETVTATQYEKRLSTKDPFKRKRYWHWSIVNASGRKLAQGEAPNRVEARQAATKAYNERKWLDATL